MQPVLSIIFTLPATKALPAASFSACSYKAPHVPKSDHPKEAGYTYEEVGDTVRVLSPNAEIWRFYFKDNLLGHIEITRDLNYMDSAY